MQPPWRGPLDAAIAAHGDDPTSRYVQLATTAGSEGYPANRTLVFRGFAGPDGLLFTADARSDKVREFRSDRRAEACWYFPRTREQFRLRGAIRVVVGAATSLGAARAAVWLGLSDAVRVQFTWPRPGARRVEGIEAFTKTPPGPENPSPNFALLVLTVDRVDRLDLKGEAPTRWIDERRRVAWFKAERAWRSREVNP